MRAAHRADFIVANRLEKTSVNISTVIPSEVEESRDVTLGYFCGVPRLRFALLGMTGNP
jgi:hypothetical protein